MEEQHQPQNTKQQKAKIRKQKCSPWHALRCTVLCTLSARACVRVWVCVCMFLWTECVHHWLLLGYEDFSTTFRNKWWDVKRKRDVDTKKEKAAVVQALWSGWWAGGWISAAGAGKIYIQTVRMFGGGETRPAITAFYLETGLRLRTACRPLANWEGKTFTLSVKTVIVLVNTDTHTNQCDHFCTSIELATQHHTHSAENQMHLYSFWSQTRSTQGFISRRLQCRDITMSPPHCQIGSAHGKQYSYYIEFTSASPFDYFSKPFLPGTLTDAHIYRRYGDQRGEWGGIFKCFMEMRILKMSLKKAQSVHV